MTRSAKRCSVVILSAIVALVWGAPALAHCDAEDGPVIQEARVALETGDVSPALKWVGPGDEPAIRELFSDVMTVRATSPEAAEIADRLFFETLVRLHRAGEGAPFEGIQPAGQQEPFVVRIDSALATGEGDAVADAIASHVRQGIASRFAAVERASESKDSSPEAGRAYVAAYVELVHFIKGIHEAVEAGGTHSHAESAHAAHGGVQ